MNKHKTTSVPNISSVDAPLHQLVGPTNGRYCNLASLPWHKMHILSFLEPHYSISIKTVSLQKFALNNHINDNMCTKYQMCRCITLPTSLPQKWRIAQFTKIDENVKCLKGCSIKTITGRELKFCM